MAYNTFVRNREGKAREMVPSKGMVMKTIAKTNRKIRTSESVSWLDSIASKSTIRTVWRDGDETTGSLNGNYYTFTGRRSDPESDLMYYRYRYYSPELGRFVSRDPIGYLAGMNLHAAYFVPNQTDPSGLKPKCCTPEELADATTAYWECIEGVAATKKICDDSAKKTKDDCMKQALVERDTLYDIAREQYNKLMDWCNRNHTPGSDGWEKCKVVAEGIESKLRDLAKFNWVAAQGTCQSSYGITLLSCKWDSMKGTQNCRKQLKRRCPNENVSWWW